MNNGMRRMNFKEEELLDGAVEDIELMTANLIKIKREITERDEGQDMESVISEKQECRKKQLQAMIRNQYNEYLIRAQMPSNHEEKLQILLNQPLETGTCIALFQMVFYFREAISEEILEEIAEKAEEKLLKEKLNPAQLTCIIQLLAICGIYNENVLGYIVEAMLEEQISFDLCFIYLSNMGYHGLSALVQLAREDFKDFPQQILDNLSRTEEIMRQMLIPILVSDLQTAKNTKQKLVILSILNRLNNLVGTSSELYPLLIEMLQNNTIDRGFVASVLRSSGMQGEKILLEFIHRTNNEKIILPIISVLPWRVHSEPVLRVKVIEYSLGSNFLPGTLYQYEGKIQPSVFCFDDEDCCDSLCLNARDLVAALQRLLTEKETNCEHEQTMRTIPPNNIKMFTLHEIINNNQKQTIQISSDCIKSLVRCLSNENADIREASLNSLGLIGLPQAYDSIQSIYKCLWDTSCKARSMSCWTLSKICDQPSKQVIQRLVELLRDNFWKVRVSSCICIGNIVKEPYDYVVEGLMKCLKDNSVNKVTVCEAIIRLGKIGEELLIQILKTISNNDFKLRQAIIYCLREADIKSSTIDYVLEEIFKNCKHTRVETRVLCLETLNCLRVRAAGEEQQIVYLKAKNILPFYYYFLEDPVQRIRELASQFILSFGGQAELIFIEGMTKGSSLVRMESAKGLAKLGIQNFRALILGLRDEDAKVKKVAADVILQNFTALDVCSHYMKKHNQSAALLCNLKDILSSGGLQKPMKIFLKDVISSIEKHHKSHQSFRDSFMNN